MNKTNETPPDLPLVPESIGAVPIDEEINGLEDIVEVYMTHSDDPSYVEDATYCRQRASLFRYLRDEYSARTVGDAIGAVDKGSVPSEVIELWIRLGILPKADWELGAIEHGYPHLQDLTTRLRAFYSPESPTGDGEDI